MKRVPPPQAVPRQRFPNAMPEEKFTRCSTCRTVFRVTPAQLQLRAGQVRCGHCKTVFDGVANSISLAPTVRGEDDDYAMDELAQGPATVTLRNAQALDPPAQEKPAAPTPFDFEIAEAAQAEPSPSGPPRWPNILLGAAVPILLLALVGQSVFHFRDALASRWPGTTPALARMCGVVGCVLHPLREIAGLSIDASDLQADPAHRGLLVLTATLRNRASYALAYPHLELTLTDAQDQVVVRRALSPREYAGGTADLAGGIGANAEVAVKLFIDASASTQAGYRVYLFYP